MKSSLHSEFCDPDLIFFDSSFNLRVPNTTAVNIFFFILFFKENKVSCFM